MKQVFTTKNLVLMAMFSALAASVNVMGISNSFYSTKLL